MVARARVEVAAKWLPRCFWWCVWLVKLRVFFPSLSLSLFRSLFSLSFVLASLFLFLSLFSLENQTHVDDARLGRVKVRQLQRARPRREPQKELAAGPEGDRRRVAALERRGGLLELVGCRTRGGRVRDYQ